MAFKKTVYIVELISEVNRRNAESTCSPDMRMGHNMMLESILMDANVYAGFGYYEAHQVPEGHKPGIIFNRENPKNNQFPDESRRFYYSHRNLKASPIRTGKGTKQYKIDK
jgi:hypothetical protein